MKTLLFLCIIISFSSVAQSNADASISGKVLSESYVPISSASQIDTTDKHTIRIKYSCLGATQYYVKLDILNIDTQDTLALYTEAHVFYEQFLPTQLIDQYITAKVSSKSSLLHHNCGYKLPKGDHTYWLNGNSMMVLVDKM